MKYIWDEEKNIKNKKKHHVSFAEASTIFENDYFTFNDDKHSSKKEKRFIAIGRSIRRRVLFVCYCIKLKNKIRIISARKAKKNERRAFYEKCN